MNKVLYCRLVSKVEVFTSCLRSTRSRMIKNVSLVNLLINKLKTH